MAKTFEIDGDKLLKELEKRNLSKRIVSIELGHGANLLDDSIRRGRLNNGAGKMLEVLYHIKKEDYEKKPQILEGVTEEPPANEAINIKDLYTLIYEAVKQAGVDARREWEKEKRAERERFNRR